MNTPTLPLLALTVACATLTSAPLNAQTRSTVIEKRGGSSSAQSGGNSSGGSFGSSGSFGGGSAGGFSGGSSGGGGFSSGGGSSFGTGGGGQNFNRRFETRGRSGSRPIVVSNKALDAKELGAIEEDLGIMTRLLEKVIEREAGAGGPPNALGIALTQLDGRGPSALLLEGYGAVFTLPTRLPLTPPPARAASSKQPAPPTDSPWEQTRREMFGGAGAGRAEPGRRDMPGGFPPGFNPPPGLDMGQPFAPAEFDPKRVENLKKGLLETLKHAGNIRALKSEDSLTIVVQTAGTGPFGGGGEFFSETRTMSSTSVNGEPPRVETHVSRDGGPGASRAATLTLRAKKSDCEDFAKGKLTLDQFAKKVPLNVQ